METWGFSPPASTSIWEFRILSGLFLGVHYKKKTIVDYSWDLLKLPPILEDSCQAYFSTNAGARRARAPQFKEVPSVLSVGMEFVQTMRESLNHKFRRPVVAFRTPQILTLQSSAIFIRWFRGHATKKPAMERCLEVRASLPCLAHLP